MEFAGELPAYAHDIAYRTKRRLLAQGLITEAEELREYAGGMMLVRMLRKVNREGWRIKYYDALHVGGSSSARPHPDEAYTTTANRGSHERAEQPCQSERSVVFTLARWHGRQGSNLGPTVLETAALPTELRPSFRRGSCAVAS
jgi:hypothetical protein